MATGGALLDIGANIGLTSIPHAVLGDFHPVVAVEPEPRNFACLEWNAKANGAEMICRRAAVADKLGTLYLKIKSNPTHHHLSKDGKGEPVDVVTLGQLVDEIGRVSLVKVDVQGAEADVLRGACDLLHKWEAAWHMEIMGPKNAEPEDTEFIVLAVETHFDGFMDTRSDAPEILSVTHFRDYLGSLRRKFTDFMFVP